MLVIVATVIPVLFLVLHFISTPTTGSRFRSSLIDYYVEIGSIEDRDQAVVAIRRFGKYIRRLRKWYVRFFVATAALCFVSSVVGTASFPRPAAEKSLLATMRLDVDAHLFISQNLVMRQKVASIYFYKVGPTSCTKLKDPRPFAERKLGQYEKLSSFVRSLSDSEISEIFVASEIISDAYVFVTVLVAVLLSTKLTVFLMERLAVSRAKMWLAFVTSVAVAVLSPFVAIELTFYAGASAALAIFGTIPDFYDIDVPSVANVSFSLANALTVATMAPEALLQIIFLRFDFGSRVHTILFTAYSIVVVPMMTVHFTEFLKQIRQFNSFDFNISELNGIRNWGVFTDLSFSISYIIVTYLLKMAAAREAVKEYVLRYLQEIDSDPQGPFMSLAGKTKLLLTALIALIPGRR